MTQLDLSAIICTYAEDRWDNLTAAVESLQHQISLPREVIVVVDHNPRLLERARAHFQGVVVIDNQQSRGLSGARNTGVLAARGKLVAFLDDDATAAADWLARLSQWCEDPRVLGAGGDVEPVWARGRPTWFPEEFFWVIGCTYRGLPESAAVVRNPFGGAMCVRREVFEAIGGLRTEMGHVGAIPLGCEETEFCIRARRYRPDGVFIHDPQAKIYHRVPSARARWRYFFSRCYAEGLSKAAVSFFVGAGDGLSSERDYVTRTLPRGALRAMQAVLSGDPHGVARAGAIIAGLAMTGTGYLMGRMRQRVRRRRSALPDIMSAGATRRTEAENVVVDGRAPRLPADTTVRPDVFEGHVATLDEFAATAHGPEVENAAQG